MKKKKATKQRAPRRPERWVCEITEGYTNQIGLGCASYRRIWWHRRRSKRYRFDADFLKQNVNRHGWRMREMLTADAYALVGRCENWGLRNLAAEALSRRFAEHPQDVIHSTGVSGVRFYKSRAAL